jgi:signal transduction histidine kinase
MYSEANNDALACIVKSNPEIENLITTIIEDHKKSTSMLVHELRNPLTLLKGTIQYIETKHPEVKEYKYWEQLYELLTDMENVMSDASLLNSFNQINKVEVNLIDLIKNIVNNFMPQAFNKEIELSYSIDEEYKPMFSSYSCDAAKLKHAVTNLLKNAFEAVQSGGFIHIELKYQPKSPSSPDKLSIIISNNGEPIPEEIQDSIFTPFVSYKKGGSGIGLALVKKVVDMHFGSISVKSDNMLTAFTIQLPCL